MGWKRATTVASGSAAFPSLTADGYPAALNPGQHALNAVAGRREHAGQALRDAGRGARRSIGFPLGAT